MACICRTSDKCRSEPNTIFDTYGKSCRCLSADAVGYVRRRPRFPVLRANCEGVANDKRTLLIEDAQPSLSVVFFSFGGARSYEKINV